MKECLYKKEWIQSWWKLENEFMITVQGMKEEFSKYTEIMKKNQTEIL
jgi:hypothetical protein